MLPAACRRKSPKPNGSSGVALAACYRLVAHYHWDDLIFTHISARVPGPEHHFLINPYGMLFGEITASSLVKVDLDGHKVLDSPYEVNPAGFTIHSAVHAAREDAQCVLHVHSVNGIAVSAQERGVLPLLAAFDLRPQLAGVPRLRGRGAESTTSGRAWWATWGTRDS
jgi:ribulose-5-phosphate 4-epimerase/fuculose-1-phosphate aldolase